MNNLSVLTSPFMIHALLAGVMVAICAGMLGYFVIMRRMTFASHALAHIGIPGATGAILLGLPAGLGLTVFCIGGALGISRMGRKPTEREIATGTALSLASAFGLYFSHQTSKASKEMQSVLFGNLLSVSTASLIQFAIFTLIIFITLMIIYRPLLFTSVDYEVAQTRGINYSLLNTIFVVLLGLTVVMSVQVVFWGFGVALGYPIGISAASDHPEHSAFRASIAATVGSVMNIAGPPLIGIIATSMGIRNALLVTVPLVIVAFFVADVVRERPQATQS